MGGQTTMQPAQSASEGLLLRRMRFRGAIHEGNRVAREHETPRRIAKNFFWQRWSRLEAGGLRPWGGSIEIEHKDGTVFLGDFDWLAAFLALVEEVEDADAASHGRN
jgi:hypothetical protein